MSKPKQKVTAKAKSKTPRKTVTKVNQAETGNTSSISESNRQQQINEAAYYIAEKRGFSSGSEIENWLEAEKQVDEALT